MEKAADSPIMLPFGRQVGRPLGEVQADYLHWLSRVATLSSGLRTAVVVELARRGIRPPPPPPKPLPTRRRCGPGVAIDYLWLQQSNGVRQIKRTCRRRRASRGFGPRVEPYVGLAG